MRKDSGLNIYSICMLGVLVAVNVILARYLAIDVGFARFTLGSIAPIMAGLWFGPVAGGLTGGLADLLGCFLQGYAPNPIILVASVLWGVIPALIVHASDGRRRKAVMICVSVVVCALVCTVCLTTAGLVLILGYSLPAILPTRLLQVTVMIPAYSVIANLLYFSPVTKVVRHYEYTAAGRAGRTSGAA